MANTPLGFPLYALTDSADLATKLNAISNALDAYLTANLAPRASRQVIRAGSLTVADNTTTNPAAYDSTTTNVGGVGYTAGVFTIPTTGMWLWSATATFASGGSSFKEVLYAQVNGSGVSPGREERSVAINQGHVITSTGVVPLTAGDQIRVAILQNSGSSVAVTPNAFTVTRIA